MKCPICGGNVAIFGQTNSIVGVMRTESVCCGVSAELLNNWEGVIEGLPDELQELAVQQDRAAHEAEQLAFVDAGRAAAELRERYRHVLPDRLSKVKNPDFKGSPFGI